MDPSEFEGTVARQGEVLHAGKLEELLLGVPAAFTWLDLSAESGDIYLSIYNLQQTLDSTKSSGSVESFVAQLDEQTMRMADLKEEYLLRRKALTAKVKAFSQNYLDQRSAENMTSERSLELVQHCSGVVDSFKKEFDFLAQLSKSSEAAFISAYKYIREMPNYQSVVQNCLQACLKLQDVLKRAQEQLNTAQSLLAERDNEDSSVPQQSALKQAAEMEALRQRCEAEKEEVRQRAQSDLLDLRAQHDVATRSRENALNSRYEQQQLDAQHRTDAMLAAKDTYIANLLQSLQEHQQKAMLLEERGRAADNEDMKRKRLEDRLREAIVSGAEAASDLERSRSEAEALAQRLLLTQQTADSDRHAADEELRALREDMSKMQTKLADAAEQLLLRPPIDFSGLADRVGYAFGDGAGANWAALEMYLADTVRRQGSEIIAMRLKDAEQSKQLAALTKAHDEMLAELTARQQEVRELEREINVAQQANRASRQAGAGVGRLRALDSPAAPLAVSGAEAWALTVDLESGEDSATLGTDQLQQVLQQQRDRYMRASQTMQQEVATQRSLLDRLQDEQTQLRNDNLELYRRLRVLRLNQGIGQQDVRTRRAAGRADDDDEDDLDHKYRSLYDEELSPFQVAELDKQQIISKLSLADRVVATLLRYAMQDTWTRQAFMCYLLLVHLFALLYCFQVLNPELAGEVDAHLKARWAQETFDMAEHPDHE